MSKAAAAEIGAETEQDFGFADEAAPAFCFLTEAEARAAFAMFGDLPDPVSTPTPANDRGAIRAFPDRPRARLRFEPQLAARALQALDWAMIVAALQWAALWGTGQSLLQMGMSQALVFLAAGAMLKLGLWATGAYRVSPERIRPEHGSGGLALGAIGGVALAALAAPDPRAAAALASSVPCAAILLALVHAAFALWTRAAFRAGVFSENIVLVGANSAAANLIARARATGAARIVAVVDDRLGRAPEQVAGVPVAGTVDQLLYWDGLPRVDRVVVAVTQRSEARMRAIIERLARTPNRVDILLDYPTEAARGRGLECAAGAGLMRVSGRKRDLLAAAAKRGFDVAAALALLVLAAPLLLLVAVALRIDTRRTTLRRAQKLGLNQRGFDQLAFDVEGALLGSILRRAHIDQLPALWNVLVGDMSFVGPRPHAPSLRIYNAAPSDLMAD